MQAGDKMRIAVCDDDEGVCSQIERWVLQYNVQKGIRIEVEIYNSAETLIQHLHKREWYDLLFLDIELPQKNGIELGQMIREKFGNELTHIVFISGKIDYCTWLFQIEPLNFHYKPLKREKVIQDIEKVLGKGNVGINLDPANLIMYGKANPVDALEVFGEYVRGIHGKDGMYPTDGHSLGAEVPLGQGKVNYPAFVAKLKEIGYEGDITIEREISGEEQKKDIIMAKEVLDKLIG